MPGYNATTDGDRHRIPLVTTSFQVYFGLMFEEVKKTMVFPTKWHNTQSGGYEPSRQGSAPIRANNGPNGLPGVFIFPPEPHFRAQRDGHRSVSPASELYPKDVRHSRRHQFIVF